MITPVIKKSSLGRNRTAAVIQNAADLIRELTQGERLLKKIGSEISYVVVDHGLPGITGDEQHPRFWTQRQQFLCQLPSAHLRHHDIGDGQMNCRRMVLRNSQSVGAISGFQDLVAAKSKEFGSGAAQSVFILD